MSKFSKKIKKYLNDDHSVLVIGQGFGYLEDLSNIFKTVVVVNSIENQIKSKNIVYRKNFDNIADIGLVSAIIIDLNKTQDLELIPTYWTRFSPVILIEGNEPIDRLKSSYLYKFGYRCIEQLGVCHVWKKI
jgi:lipopolysaccharide export LptBFGC system permease protein LptF